MWDCQTFITLTPDDPSITVANYVPSSILGSVMQLIVAHCYNNKKYNEVYRYQKTLTKFEHLAINTYLNTLSFDNPYIMDVDCGTGVPFDSYFVNQSWDCKIIGIDVSKTQISKAIKNISAAKFANMDFV